MFTYYSATILRKHYKHSRSYRNEIHYYQENDDDIELCAAKVGPLDLIIIVLV